MPDLARRAAITLLFLCLLAATRVNALRHEPGRQTFGGLTSPPDAPSVVSVESSPAGLYVRLALSGRLADGRILPFLPESVLVRNNEPGAALSAWTVLLEADGLVRLEELPAGRLDLTFSLVAGGLTGMPSASVRLMTADSNEPNGTPDKAAPLVTAADGSFTAEGMIDNSLDFDFYHFELRAGDSVTIHLAGLDSSGSALQPSVSLLDSSGTVLDHSEDGSVVGTRASGAGHFLLLVTDRAFLEGKSFQNAVDRFYRIEARRLNRRGDVDGDGKLSYRDAFLVFFLVRGVLDTLNFTPAQLVAADWDGDGILAGDNQDYEGLLKEIFPVPSRDPGSPGAKRSTALAAAGEGELLVFPDGSALRVEPEGRLELVSPGKTALSLLALAGSIQHADILLPKAMELYQNTPNPFNPSTLIQFNLPGAAAVRLEVFDLRGRRVATLANNEYPAGIHAVHWSGRDDSGRPLADGVYFYRLRSDKLSLTRKMVLLK
jgi:hypothetical protein